MVTADIESKIEEKINELPKTGKRRMHFFQQVPVLGFNSGKYDLNLVKTHLFKHFEGAVAAKKGSSYMFVAPDEFKFLDLCNYLAPGFSLSMILKAYQCNLQ